MNLHTPPSCCDTQVLLLRARRDGNHPSQLLTNRDAPVITEPPFFEMHQKFGVPATPIPSKEALELPAIAQRSVRIDEARPQLTLARH